VVVVAEIQRMKTEAGTPAASLREWVIYYYRWDLQFRCSSTSPDLAIMHRLLNSQVVSESSRYFVWRLRVCCFAGGCCRWNLSWEGYRQQAEIL
jgi:hypothetical protein